jgi:ribonuclease D
MDKNISIINSTTKDIEDKYIDEIIKNNSIVAIDTETTGLDPLKDELCLIQLYTNNTIHLIKYKKGYSYNNVCKILADDNIIKIFHHATFDVRFLINNLDIEIVRNIRCTKILAKLLKGTTEITSLKRLLNEYLNIDINKEMQTSNWKQYTLDNTQIDYAINDVIYLERLWNKMQGEVKDKNMEKIAEQCFKFLPINAYLNNKGIKNIFEY